MECKESKAQKLRCVLLRVKDQIIFSAVFSHKTEHSVQAASFLQLWQRVTFGIFLVGPPNFECY